MIRISLLLITILILSSFAFAEKMDLSTDSLVITKLEKVYLSLDAHDAARTDMALRLADLYAERARLEAMDETAKNCDSCTNSTADRAKALTLYQSALNTTDREERSRVILQMAHLYDLQGQSEKSGELYSQVTSHKSDYTPALLGQAYLGVGEIQFRKMKYAEALADYEKALAIPETPRRAYIKYRMAWCYFHQDKLDQADKTLIEAVQGQDGIHDASFQEEGTRDLATFYSRGQVTTEEIKTLIQLSPANVRKDNLNYLASELDRLGKKKSALLVWAEIGTEQKSPTDQIEEHIRMAELHFDVGQKNSCLAEYQIAMNQWKENPCDASGDECVTLRQRLRKLILDWGHSEAGQASSSDLLKAYESYLSVFADMEVNFKAAVAARGAGQYSSAIRYYRNAADIAAAALKTGRKGNDENSLKKDFEASLFGEIEVAELTRDAVWRGQAYQHYLELNPQGSKAFEISYQKTHLAYETGQYAQAAEEFRNLALNSSEKNSPLKVKSADLALDALVLAHEEVQVTPWAQAFAKAFPERRLEYTKIASRGTLSQVALTLNNPDASRAQLEKSLAMLDTVDLTNATDSEKIAYYKDRLILAEKLQNLAEVDRAGKNLLSIKSLSTDDREFALSRRAWAAELTLNFAAAYSFSKETKMSGISEADRILKLGTLAELAGENPEKEYSRYIELTKNQAQAALIAAKLVRLSKNPSEELKRYWSVLGTDPVLLSRLSMEVFAQTHDHKVAERVVESPSLKTTAAGHAMGRFIFLNKFDVVYGRIARHQLSHSGGQKSLQVGLRQRLRLMEDMQKETARAARTQDWFLQVITLDALARQNRRLALDIITFPAPRGLSHAQHRQYTDLLVQQAEQYQAQARQISAKLNDIWNQYATTSGLFQSYQSARGPVRELLGEELKRVVRSAPRDKRHDLIEMIATRESKPASSTLKEAQASVRANPFDPKDLERLKELETKAGRDTMVAYLDARISAMHSGEEGKVR